MATDQQINQGVDLEKLEGFADFAAKTPKRSSSDLVRARPTRERLLTVWHR